MTATLAHFPWPPTPGSGAPIAWDGSGFVRGSESVRILSYQETPSHWSEALTELHEEEAGSGHPIDLASRRLALASMARLKSGSPIILDVGCSSGFFLEELSRAFPDAGLIGADYLRGPLERLARRAPGIPILQFDLRACPLPDSCVDGVTCLNVLEHIDDDGAALAHIRRILRPGGIAHIEVPAGPALYDAYDEHLMHHRRYRLGGLLELARRSGLEIERATHLGFLVFPAFWWTKAQNRKKSTVSPEEEASLVSMQIRSTRRSRILSGLMRLETGLGRFVRFPCGIRCVVVARKPLPTS